MIKTCQIVLFLVVFSSSIRAQNNIPLPFSLTVGDKEVLSVNANGIEGKNYDFLCSGIEESEETKSKYKNQFKVKDLKVSIKHTCNIDFLKLTNSLKSIVIRSVINKSGGKSTEVIDLSEYKLNLEKVLFFKEQYLIHQEKRSKQEFDTLAASNEIILKSIKSEHDGKISECRERFNIVSNNDEKGIILFNDAVEEKKDIDYITKISKYNFLVMSSNKECLEQKEYYKLKESVDLSIDKLNKYKEELNRKIDTVTIQVTKEKSKPKPTYSNDQSYWYLKRNSIICESKETLDYQTDLIAQGINKLVNNCYVTTDNLDISIVDMGLATSHIIIISNDVDVWTYSEFVEKR